MVIATLQSERECKYSKNIQGEGQTDTSTISQSQNYLKRLYTTPRYNIINFYIEVLPNPKALDKVRLWFVTGLEVNKA